MIDHLIKKYTILIVIFLVAGAGTIKAQTYNILDFKAVPGGKVLNTTAIQKAIDKCAANSGGTVLVPAGTFLTGMIRLKNNVELHLSPGAVLQSAITDKPYVSLVLIDDAVNVSVTGTGALLGDGKKYDINYNGLRPYLLFAKGSKRVKIENIKLSQPSMWTMRLYRCEGVVVTGIDIYAHANFNNDGIDIDSKDVIISGCTIDSGDDAICLKSEDPTRLCENITITNCVIASTCNFIKMGTGSVSGFKNITISNCVLKKPAESPLHNWKDPNGAFASDKQDHFITDAITGLSGIALEVVDGGTMDQVSISNISMTGVQTPIFIRLGSRSNPTGSLKNVMISNVTATSSSRMCSIISGVPGFYIENITLRDMIMTSPGGGTAENAARIVPENQTGYPENRMFGWSLPAYGLYVRHGWRM